jgi:hypothetical protein
MSDVFERTDGRLAFAQQRAEDAHTVASSRHNADGKTR